MFRFASFFRKRRNVSQIRSPLERKFKTMEEQQALWERRGMQEYKEWRAFLEGEDYAASLHVSQKQIQVEAEETADKLGLTIDTYPVQRAALIAGFFKGHQERTGEHVSS
jgi:hypothetical protein